MVLKTESSLHQKKCRFCPKSFSSQSSLGQHIKSVHFCFRFHCEKCEKTFSQKSSLQRHVLSAHCHEGAATYKSESKASSSSHVKDAHETRRYKCEQCGKCLTTQCGQRRHVAMHHEVINAPCALCGKVCSTRKLLVQHQLEHHKKLATNFGFHCNLCHRAFVYKSNLNRHKKLYHKENLPYKCLVCHLGFLSHKVLTNHKARYHKAKPVKQKRRQTRMRSKTKRAWILPTTLSHQEFAKSIAKRYKQKISKSLKNSVIDLRKHKRTSPNLCMPLNLSLTRRRNSDEPSGTQKQTTKVQRPKTLKLISNQFTQSLNQKVDLQKPSPLMLASAQSMKNQRQNVITCQTRPTFKIVSSKSFVQPHLIDIHRPVIIQIRASVNTAMTGNQCDRNQLNPRPPNLTAAHSQCTPSILAHPAKNVSEKGSKFGVRGRVLPNALQNNSEVPMDLSMNTTKNGKQTVCSGFNQLIAAASTPSGTVSSLPDELFDKLDSAMLSPLDLSFNLLKN